MVGETSVLFHVITSALGAGVAIAVMYVIKGVIRWRR